MPQDSQLQAGARGLRRYPARVRPRALGARPKLLRTVGRKVAELHSGVLCTASGESELGESEDSCNEWAEHVDALESVESQAFRLPPEQT